MTDASGFQFPRYHRFATPDIKPAERFDYWRTWYSEAVVSEMLLDPIGAVPGDFDCSAEVVELGNDVQLVEVRNGPASGRWRIEATEGPNLVRAQLFLRSERGTVHWHGTDVVPGPASLFVVGRTSGHWHAPHGLRAIQVNVSRDLLPVEAAVIDRVTDSQVRPDLVAAGAMVGAMLSGVAGRLRELSTLPAVEQATVWRSAVTMMLRALDGAAVDGVDLAPIRRLQAERFISEHLADPRLGPDLIAAALHISRRSLYQLLSTSGEGIAASIRRQRLERARTILLDRAQRHRSIAEVAAEVGLPRAAHFSRLFRSEYGVSPREFRSAS